MTGTLLFYERMVNMKLSDILLLIMKRGYHLTFRAWHPMDDNIVIDLEDSHKRRRLSKMIGSELVMDENVLSDLLYLMLREFETENDPAL